MAVDVTKVLDRAREQLGKKYVFGSAGPNTFDCSGLVVYSFKPFGINLPHHAASQAKLGKEVAKGDIQPGDLVFSDWGGGPNSHVGIAVSKNQIINAPHKGAVVRYATLTDGYLSHVTAIRRLGGMTSQTPGPSTGDIIGTAGRHVGGIVGGAVTAVDAITGAVGEGLAPLSAVGAVSDQIFKFFMPSNFLRFVAGLAGGLMLAFGIYLLTKEVRNG